MQTITGTVERINFRNEESAWTAFLLHTETGPVRATGIIPTIRLGMTLRLTGDTEHEENLLVVNDRKHPMSFNGYFTGIYIE